MFSPTLVVVVVAWAATLQINPAFSTAGNRPDPDYGKDKDHEDGVLVEGDLLLTKEQYQRLHQHTMSRGKRTKRGFATVELRRRWPNGVMPYVINPEGFTPTEQYDIIRAMTEWERYTCLRWRPKESVDKHWVRIRGIGGCMAYLGNCEDKDGQPLYLGPGCRVTMKRYLHEMGHTIGLLHEMRRPDRDNYIRVADKLLGLSPYIRQNASDIAREMDGILGIPYDIKSIMQYGAFDETVDGKPAMTAVRPSENKWIHFNLTDYGSTLSFYDAKIVNIMYNCSDHCPAKNKCTGEGFLDENCNCICPDGTTDCDRTKQPERSTCGNKFFDDWRCNYWAKQGECERDSKWMGQQCAKACGLCSPRQTSGHRSGAPSPCKNVYPDQKCEGWKWRGGCVTNREWMRQNCPETCDMCRDDRHRPDADCDNKNHVSTLCDDFAKDGGCLLRPRAMHTYCKRSCFQCHLQMSDIDTSMSEVNDTIHEEHVSCTDTRPGCADIVRLGWCDRESKNCQKSCGKCEDGTCKNLNPDADCRYREARIECLGNSVWMARHCSMSCGRRACTGAAPTAKPPTPTERPTSEPTTCRNQNDKVCDTHAVQGRCEDHREYMEKACPKSCGFCGGYRKVTAPPKSTCDDLSPRCKDWPRQGMCKAYPDMARTRCKKSCNFCS